MSLKLSFAAAAAFCGALPALAGSPVVQLTGPGSSYVTPAASAELAAICPSGQGYPTEWNWRGTADTSPGMATSGTPRIEQYRGGQLIATYATFANGPNCSYVGDGTDHTNPAGPAASGCGPFTRSHAFRLWEAGDTFLVYPAVYSGWVNQPWIGPMADGYAGYNAGIFNTPDNVTLQGVVQGGVRPVILLDSGASDNTLGQAPVYFDHSTGFTMDSIDVVARRGALVGKSGVYNLGGSNLTLSNMRVSGFAHSGANGIFGAGEYSGSLTLRSVELDHNGGPNGPAHNAYIGASFTDPNYTVNVSHSWSHHAFYGHLFKSRAQVNVFTANYFQGSVPFGNHTQAENYLLDVPNGGRLTARDNVFVKNASGPNSNGMSLTFLMEGASDSRAQSVDIENNTFVTFAETFDGSHRNYPLSFLYPNVRPDSASWPSNIPTRIIKNAFVGYCAIGDGSSPDYRGDISLTEAFSETSNAFAFSSKVAMDDATLQAYYPDYAPVVGTPAYIQQLEATLLRHATTVGAED